MNSPQFFVWSGGVINLNRVLFAHVVTRPVTQLLVVVDDQVQEPVILDGDNVGRFMLHCARFHAAFEDDKVLVNDLAKLFPAKGETQP